MDLLMFRQFKSRSLIPTVVVAAGCVLLLGSQIPAGAVVLQNKWQAGEMLNYGLTLDGTVDSMTAPDAPVMWAGLPLTATVHTEGTAQMETMKVEDDGTGTVAVRIPKLVLQGEAFEQKAVFGFDNGKSSFTLNGKPLAGVAGPQADAGAKFLTSPPYAYKISPQGKVVGFVNLTSATAAPEVAPAGGGGVGSALDKVAFAQAMIVRALPALWPGRDVNVGDTWTAAVPWLAPPTGPAIAVPAPLGRFDLTYKGTETASGLPLERVSVAGVLKLDAPKLAYFNKLARQQQIKEQHDAAAAAKPGTAVPGLPAANEITAMFQSVKGDLWFDAATGKVTKGSFILNGHTAGHIIDATTGKPGGESWADFTGSLLLQLQPAA